jgi:hypothetical protein
MTHEELVGAFTKLRNETSEQAATRMRQNDEAESAKLRVATQQSFENYIISKRERQFAELQERERQLMAWKEEIDGALAEHLKLPCPTHSPERDRWLREQEVLVETQQEIESGPSRWSSGRLREMAARDGAELYPGLAQVRQRLEQLRVETSVATSS